MMSCIATQIPRLSVRLGAAPSEPKPASRGRSQKATATTQSRSILQGGSLTGSVDTQAGLSVEGSVPCTVCPSFFKSTVCLCEERMKESKNINIIKDETKKTFSKGISIKSLCSYTSVDIWLDVGVYATAGSLPASECTVHGSIFQFVHAVSHLFAWKVTVCIVKPLACLYEKKRF